MDIHPICKTEAKLSRKPEAGSRNSATTGITDADVVANAKEAIRTARAASDSPSTGIGHIPDRLEFLRNALGISVKAFWERVVADGGFAGSRASAATYHRPNGPLSLEYLLATEQAFGVRLQWLIHGEGPMTKEEEDAGKDPYTAAALQGLMETTPLGSHITYEWRHLSAVAIKLAQSPRFSGGAESAVERHLEAGRLLGGCIAKPLEMLGVQIGFRDTLTAQAYISAAAHAIEIIAHCATLKVYDADDTTEEAPDV